MASTMVTTGNFPVPVPTAQALSITIDPVRLRCDRMIADMTDPHWTPSDANKHTDAARVHHFARMIPRNHSPFINVIEVMSYGCKIAVTKDDDAKWAALLKVMVKSTPPIDPIWIMDIFEVFANNMPFMWEIVNVLVSVPQAVIHFATFVQKHAGQSRIADLGKVKESLRHFVRSWTIRTPGEDPLVVSLEPTGKQSKGQLGFNSLWTAHLLTPRERLEEFEREPNHFCTQVQLSLTTIDANSWPTMVYSEDTPYNPDNRVQGFFESELLIGVYRSLFTGHQTAFGPPAITGKGRASISREYGLSYVTRERIAYIATMVRFALSDTAVWCDLQGAFSGKAFYDLIVDILDPQTVLGAQKLAFWQRKVYGGQTSFDQGSSATPALKRADGFANEAELIKAQFAQQLVAHEDDRSTSGPI
ncbi:uncharacterized protein BXZ73DRAFT_111379 [Epithele typhae]|uniref:uncharacterized protein n=1 Tax=Epithele typhae TaxID=378194 RepID=UPI00200852B8|nr:uncharacterized protein BXZ73DRAFT_111379 [Epithele typhae]KAH9903883.1 hypothetical protein BXZ73DRAFT_111379 [Epithele typhae]